MKCYVKNTFLQLSSADPSSVRRANSAPDSIKSADDLALRESIVSLPTILSTNSVNSRRMSEMSCFRESISSCQSVASSAETLASISSSDQSSCRQDKKPVLKLDKFAQKNEVSENDRTTVMLRNIPCRYSQDQLLDTVKSFGIPCNFLYLAPAKNGGGNLGYAFVNFLSSQGAKEFMAAFAGVQFTHIPRCRKRAIVAWATLQGYKQNVRFYNRTKCVMTMRGPRVARNAKTQI